MSELSVTKITSRSTNTPPVIEDDSANEVGQFCRAWVNFNGVGTVTIRDSFNVSSITDNGVGVFEINFTNNMPNTNYSVSAWAGLEGNTSTTAYTIRGGNVSMMQVGLLKIRVITSSILADLDNNCVSVFAN